MTQPYRSVMSEAIAGGAQGCSGGCSNRPCEVDHASAETIYLALSEHGYRVVPADFTVLTVQRVEAAMHAMNGCARAMAVSGRREFDHRDARCVLEAARLSSQHTERKDTPEWGPDHPSYDEMGQ